MCPTKKRQRITSERKHNETTKTFRKSVLKVQMNKSIECGIENIEGDDRILYGSANDVNYNNFVV